MTNDIFTKKIDVELTGFTPETPWVCFVGDDQKLNGHGSASEAGK